MKLAPIEKGSKVVEVVMKNPDIIFKEWTKELRKKLHRSGVYVVMLDGVCAYVGQSKKLDLRMNRFFDKNHISTRDVPESTKGWSGYKFDKAFCDAKIKEFLIFFIDVDCPIPGDGRQSHTLLEVEAKMIFKLKPKYNMFPRLCLKMEDLKCHANT